ncbi:MAG TPA: hypothetical protein VG076_00025 [Acidimicrobiales bacterium]|jgi:hypothetical protein|nr:hypothetical protein [Acidimicrobiales bacterium]
MRTAAPRLHRRFVPLTIGSAVVAGYLVAVVIALASGHRVLPMFDGYTPPPKYRWVNPPTALAPGNVRPEPNDTDVPLGPSGSEQAGAQSEDGQLTLNLAPNAVPAHAPDTSVRVHVQPLDPATLGPVPAEFRANGNAYRVTMMYQPSGVEATTITSPGNILLTVPLAPAGLLSSNDGRTWTNIGKQAVPTQSIVGGPFNATGWYLGATHPQTAATSGSGSGGVILVAVLVGALALFLGLFPLIRKRVRGRP